MSDDTNEVVEGAKKIYQRVKNTVLGFPDETNSGPADDNFHPEIPTKGTPYKNVDEYNKVEHPKKAQAPKGKDAAKPNTYKDGGIVQKTGKALVHKGEEVLTKDDPRHMFSLASSGMGDDKPEAPKKEISHRVIRKVKNGHIIEHHFTHPSHKMEEHVAGSKQGMLNHVEANTPDDNDGDEGGPLSAAAGADLGA